MKLFIFFAALIMRTVAASGQAPNPSLAKPSASPDLLEAHNIVMSLNGTVSSTKVDQFCSYFANLKKIPDSEFTFFSLGQESVSPEEMKNLGFDSLLKEFFAHLRNKEHVHVEFHGIEDQSKPVTYYHPEVKTYFISKYTIHFKNDNAFGKNAPNS